MDPASLSAHFSTVRDNLPLFGFLLFSLPITSIFSWFVPSDLESDAAKMHISMQHSSVAFAHRVDRNSRDTVAVRKSSTRWSR